MKKIKLNAGWTTSEEITKRLIEQFKTPDIDLSNVEFVYDDSYDIIVFFNYINENIKPGSKSYVFPHEPTWSGSHQKYFEGDTVIFGFEKEIYTGNCIETTAHTFYGGRGSWVDPTEFWNCDNLINGTFTKDKVMSSSVTQLKEKLGDNCLYPQRYKIGEMINELDFIDVYGGWNKNSVKRHDSLVNYKFNISIENEYQKNWISEKFYDCILTNTVPIYFGCKNIREIYPENGYILIDDINDIIGISEMLYYINENAEEIYNIKIDGLLKIKNRYFNEYNLLKKIISL